jgi:hypothetical protein
VKQSFNQSLTISDSHRNTRLQLCLLALLIVAAAISLPVAAQSIQVPQPSPGLMPNPAAGKDPVREKLRFLPRRQSARQRQGAADAEQNLRTLASRRRRFPAGGEERESRAHHWKFGDMAPVPGLTPDDVAQITAYVRLEQRKAGIQ